ncbi:MAG: hypothetical protein FJ087_06305 [Deltaproteobacteria bacterium]|nr:hypothetical protein [Deltaproteobacteria bacterium]
MSRLVRWTGLVAFAALAMGSCGEGTGGVRVEPVDAPQETAGGDLPDSPDACVPKCGGKECGPDGCGRTCGDCVGTCQEGVCES